MNEYELTGSYLLAHRHLSSELATLLKKMPFSFKCPEEFWLSLLILYIRANRGPSRLCGVEWAQARRSEKKQRK